MAGVDMSIETSGVNAVAQPVPARNGTSGTRNDARDADAAGGFSAMLSAADAPPPSTQDATAQNGQSGQNADTSAEKDTDEKSDSTTIATPLPTAADAPVADNSALIAALLAAVQGTRQGLTDAATAAATGTAGEGAKAEQTDPLATVLNGKAGKAADLAGLKANLVGVDAKAANEHTKTALGDYASVLDQLRARGEKAGAAVTSATAANAAGATTTLAGKTALQAQVDLAARNDRAGNALTQAANTAQSVATAAMVATQLESADTIKAAQSRVGGVDSAPLGGLLPDRAFAHGSFTPTVQYDASTGASLSTPLSSSAEVADQVSYWVAQGVQNAEMTVEGANAERVHVSISLSGNEARVELRADQAMTREMLANASSHLKDLLDSQGLVLSGFTVSSSGSGGAGGAGGADGMGGQQQQQARSNGGFTGQGERADERAAVPTRAPAGELDLYV